MKYLTFSDWCKTRGLATELEWIDVVYLNEQLRKFYAEARSQQGESYSRSFLLGMRAAIERHLNNPPYNKAPSLSKGQAFRSSNKVLNAKIKVHKNKV